MKSESSRNNARSLMAMLRFGCFNFCNRCNNRRYCLDQRHHKTLHKHPTSEGRETSVRFASASMNGFPCVVAFKLLMNLAIQALTQSNF